MVQLLLPRSRPPSDQDGTVTVEGTREASGWNGERDGEAARLRPTLPAVEPDERTTCPGTARKDTAQPATIRPLRGPSHATRASLRLPTPTVNRQIDRHFNRLGSGWPSIGGVSGTLIRVGKCARDRRARLAVRRAPAVERLDPARQPRAPAERCGLMPPRSPPSARDEAPPGRRATHGMRIGFLQRFHGFSRHLVDLVLISAACDSRRSSHAACVRRLRGA